MTLYCQLYSVQSPNSVDGHPVRD